MIDISFAIDVVVALIITFTMSFFHELIHIKEAKKLGCVVKSKSFLKNEIVVDTKTEEQVRRISLAPYKILLPLNIMLLGFGLVTFPVSGSVGIIIGSSAVIFLHLLSYRLEGRDENVQDKSISNKPL